MSRNLFRLSLLRYHTKYMPKPRFARYIGADPALQDTVIDTVLIRTHGMCVFDKFVSVCRCEGNDCLQIERCRAVGKHTKRRIHQDSDAPIIARLVGIQLALFVCVMLALTISSLLGAFSYIPKQRGSGSIKYRCCSWWE